MIVVGEIGIDPDKFSRLKWWELRAVIRGYNRRHRHLWSVTRWHAFNIMSAIPYTDLQKAGITKPTDLIKFPWEMEPSAPITDEEAEELKREMEALNSMQQS